MFKITAIALITLVFVVTGLMEECHAGKRLRAFNRIVIVLDASGSYQSRRIEAVDKATDLINKIAGVKTKRHEGKDQIVIVSLDSSPEIIWEGTKDELTPENKKYLMQRFEARKDYEACTDVDGGMQLAAELLNRDPAPEYKYLFVFSDLVHEPPNGAAKSCAPVVKPSVPSEIFPWDAFADVNASVLWMPIDQKLAWKKSVKDAGLESSFRLYAESESGTIRFSAPKKARHVMTEDEKVAGKEKAGGFFSGIFKFVIVAFTAVVTLIGGIGLVVFVVTRLNNKKQGR